MIGDKAYISTQVKDQLAQVNRIDLMTVPRRNQKQQILQRNQAVAKLGRWLKQLMVIE